MFSIRDDRFEPEQPRKPSFLGQFITAVVAILLVLLIGCGNVYAKSLSEDVGERMREALLWLEENTDYNIPAYLPKVELTTIKNINKLYYRSGYTNQMNVAAAFIFRNQTIHIPSDPNVSPMIKQGYYIHEGAHWLQFTNGTYESYKSWCSDWDEIEAYTLHLKWIEERSLPKEHVENIRAWKDEYINRCQSWNEIASGWRLWKLTGVYYCNTEGDAQILFKRAESDLDLLLYILTQNLFKKVKLCWKFQEGDVGIVTRIIESRFIYPEGYTHRLVEVRVRNPEDAGNFTKTLFAISPIDFHQLKSSTNLQD